MIFEHHPIRRHTRKETQEEVMCKPRFRCCLLESARRVYSIYLIGCGALIGYRIISDRIKLRLYISHDPLTTWTYPTT
ncbi:hypothetical protein L208DRAFT_733864 [Tricholoma matsutake]|nr:hypothetical protein L208DRAFT_733864 [Tricholoma matsutake 945]